MNNYNTIFLTRLTNSILNNKYNRRESIKQFRRNHHIVRNLEELKNKILCRIENRGSIERDRYQSRKFKNDIYRNNDKVMCSNDGIYPGLKDYYCIMRDNEIYLKKNRAKVDHVDEFSLTFNDNINNMRLLCADCHDEKTIRFQSNNSLLLGKEIDDGYRIKNNLVFNILYPDIIINLM